MPNENENCCSFPVQHKLKLIEIPFSLGNENENENYIVASNHIATASIVRKKNHLNIRKTKKTKPTKTPIKIIAPSRILLLNSLGSRLKLNLKGNA